MIFRITGNYFLMLLGLVFLLAGACRTHHANTDAQQAEADSVSLETNTEIDNIPQIKQLTAQITADTGNAGLYFLRGNLYFKANSPKQAIADFYRALALDSLNSTYYLAAADVFFTGNNPTTAVKLLEKAQTALPDSLNIKTELGKYYYYVQEYDKSVNALTVVTNKQPGNAEAWFWLGMTHRDKEQNTKAIACFNRAVQADASFYNAYIIMANLQAQSNNPQAIANYNKAIELDTASIEARYGKAMFLQNTGKTQEALEEYRKIVYINPQHADTHYNVGYIYFNNKDYNNALKSFNIAIRTSPAFAKAYYMRGLCAEKLGKIPDARTDYESALKFDPELTLAKEALNRVH